MTALHNLLSLLIFFLSSTAASWTGTTVMDLHNQYSNIFRFGNRNAASHRMRETKAEKIKTRKPAPDSDSRL